MGGQIFDPGGSGTISPGEAPSPGGAGTPTQPSSGATYIKLVVPNFNGDDSPGNLNPMGSYLRIGAVEPSPYVPGQRNTGAGTIDTTGEDLAALVQGFADDMRDRGTSNDSPTSPAESLPPGDTPAEGAMAASPGLGAMVAESQVLHKKGGWRDHTDGNRITTTRGDKVEVIRGNYKMVVLGRQGSGLDPSSADLNTATGVDMSGGLADALDLNKATSTAHSLYNLEYKWEMDSDRNWGWTQTTVTGAFDPNNPNPTGNGQQISITWVDEIQTYFGGPPLGDPAYSPAPAELAGIAPPEYDGFKRVNRIYSRTWANVLDQLTDAATSITQVVQTPGPMNTVTTAGWYTGGSSVQTGFWLTTIPPPASLPSPATELGQMTTIVASDSDMNLTTVSGRTLTTLTATYGAGYGSGDSGSGDMTTIVSSSGALSVDASSVAHMSNKTSCSADIYQEMTAQEAITTFVGTPVNTNTNLSALIMNFSICAMLMEIKTLIHLDVHVGFHLDFHFGSHIQVSGDEFKSAGDEVTMKAVRTLFAGEHSVA